MTAIPQVFSLHALLAFILTLYIATTGHADEIISRKIEQAKELIDRQLELDKISKEVASRWRLALQVDPPDRQRIYIPSTEPKSIGKIHEQFQDQADLEAIFQELGQLYFASAQKAEKSKDFAKSFQLSFRALAFDPTNENLRKKLQGSIQSLTQKKVMNRVPSNLPELNWKAGSYASVTTTNFEILSRAPSKQSANLAELCEQTYCAWQQLFHEFWRSDNSSRKTDFTKFRVVLFKNREEYLNQLQQLEPNIGVSTGYYSPKLKIAFFYWDEQKSIPTMRHELVHQFFVEATTRPVQFDVDEQAGIWAVEGVAMYFESLTKIAEAGQMEVFEIGGWDSPRLQSARYRRLRDEYWIPWGEFQEETGQRLRRRDDIAMFYSQAAGLTHWLLDGDEQSKQNFHDYLASVYSGKPRDLLHLDRQSDQSMLASYDPFLLVDRALIRNRSSGPERSEIVLARTEVQSEDLLAWPRELRHLQWLDLSFTRVDDSLFATDAEAPWDVVRLTLEETQITDQSLATIAKMPRLIELDLSRCKVTDRGISQLKGLQKLKVLWLSDTQVTNASLETLRTLKSLEQLELNGTKIDDETKNKLRKFLPKWKSP